MPFGGRVSSYSRSNDTWQAAATHRRSVSTDQGVHSCMRCQYVVCIKVPLPPGESSVESVGQPSHYFALIEQKQNRALVLDRYGEPFSYWVAYTQKYRKTFSIILSFIKDRLLACPGWGLTHSMNRKKYLLNHTSWFPYLIIKKGTWRSIGRGLFELDC